MFHVRTLTLHIIHRVLPGAQPLLCQLVKACSTFEVDCKVNLVPILVQAQDIMSVGRSPAASSLEATIQEFSDPQSNPDPLHSCAGFQYMPELNVHNSYVPNLRKCLEERGDEVPSKVTQAGHQRRRPLPGLGALWPRKGWSMIQREST